MALVAMPYAAHRAALANSHAMQPARSHAMSPVANPALGAPITALLQLGHESNLRHCVSIGLLAITSNGQAVAGPRAIQTPALIKLDRETELCWVAAGRAAEKMGNLNRALSCYDSVLSHNPQNPDALVATAGILRTQEDFGRAADFYLRALAVKDGDGEMWGSLGHCFLMTDDLPKAYNCYQQAIVNSVDSKNEPKLWYGIGILYDRYGSLEHAEEAFASVIKMDPDFDKANEIYFRLGIIYKQQKNSRASLQCFQYILANPPRPLTEIDIWFQIGHVYEQQQDFDLARDAYDRVLTANPNHAKVLQQLGGLYQRQKASFYDPERSVAILTKSLAHDSGDAFSWYLLGRAYMTSGNFGKAYEAYQQAVYRDGKNPAFWCSIGVLYCNINQYHDSLDAYSRAIRINPYLSEVWFNLGALYESCNDQMSDAVDAYQRTLQLDPGNATVQNRLEEIRAHQQKGTTLSAPPQPRDISPSSTSWALASSVGGPPGDAASEAPSRPISHGSGAHPSPPLAQSVQSHDAVAGGSNVSSRDAKTRRPSTGLPNGSSNDVRRMQPSPYAPAIAGTRSMQGDRSGLPQMRSNDYAMSYEAQARRAGGMQALSRQTDYLNARRVMSPPQQHHALPGAPTHMPPLPPSMVYGGSLPALQTSDRELQERRWAREEQDRKGVKMTSPRSQHGSISPVDRRNSKGRTSDENGRHKTVSPKVRSPSFANEVKPTMHQQQPSAAESDEGAATLLALAAGGQTGTPLSQKRASPPEERSNFKRPRTEASAHIPTPVAAS